MNMLNRLMLASVVAGASALAHSQTPLVSTRGQLLYTTHCISCHTTQIHWRIDRQAYDWGSLKVQVNRWQTNAGLGWEDADIVEVSRHLNDTMYHFPQPAGPAGIVSERKVR